MTNSILLNKEWLDVLEKEFLKDYMQNLKQFLRSEIAEGKTIYPKGKQMFNALNLTKPEAVKVILLGQDPYHGENQAHGLAFSVTNKQKLPPSLRNIFLELKNDLGIDNLNKGDLTPWAKEGVLLLNTVLSVEASKAGSHRNKGWEIFTDQIIQYLASLNKPKIFILWGRDAISKKKLIDQNKHFIIESVHPSPLSAHRGFLGSKPFSKTNQFLVNLGEKPINWQT